MPGSIKERLIEAYKINLRDAEELVRIFRASGDQDNLRRAQADLDKWQAKLAAAQAAS